MTLDTIYSEADGRTHYATPDDSHEWRVGQQTVVHGDCLQILRALPDASIDVVVTSPPYNIGVAYRSYDDRRPRETYLEWLAEVGVEIARVLNDSGSLFLNVGSTCSDPWIAMDVAGTFRRSFTLQNNITWVKSVSVGENTFGHFKPINSRRFLNHNHESIFHFTKSGAVEVAQHSGLNVGNGTVNGPSRAGRRRSAMCQKPKFGLRFISMDFPTHCR